MTHHRQVSYHSYGKSISYPSSMKEFEIWLHVVNVACDRSDTADVSDSKRLRKIYWEYLKYQPYPKKHPNVGFYIITSSMVRIWVMIFQSLYVLPSFSWSCHLSAVKSLDIAPYWSNMDSNTVTVVNHWEMILEKPRLLFCVFFFWGGIIFSDSLSTT
jgi:hypothetical protein